MKQLYIHCPMGAAGDMLMGALFDLCQNREAFLSAFEALQLPGVTLHPEQTSSHGQDGFHMRVYVHGHEELDHPHHHHHNTPLDIAKLIAALPVSESVRQNAQAVYDRITRAEAKAHGVPVSQVHFHEVGALDAVADVVGCCLLMEQLAPEQITVSPIALGQGHFHCAHGMLPVPAPATRHLLEGIPSYMGPVDGELCTPTGAALLTHFAAQFGDCPFDRSTKTGCGIGSKEFGRPNCIYAALCE